MFFFLLNLYLCAAVLELQDDVAHTKVKDSVVCSTLSTGRTSFCLCELCLHALTNCYNIISNKLTMLDWAMTIPFIIVAYRMEDALQRRIYTLAHARRLDINRGARVRLHNLHLMSKFTRAGFYSCLVLRKICSVVAEISSRCLFCVTAVKRGKRRWSGCSVGRVSWMLGYWYHG